MAANRLADAVHRLTCRLGTDDRSGLPDGHLVTLFVEHRDTAAFEVLVRRHGPMVLGVCRRLLGDGPDADDAFQAAFLVLVRKAKSVRPRERVGYWLYGVARTTAVRAKSLRAKRRSREGPLVETPDPDSAGHPPDDRLALLDLELGRLPEKYRVPIVLCELGGKSHKEAAAQLGWPIGTLSGRLSRGRQMLADRLTRRGLPAGAAFAAAGVSESLTAAAVRFAAGGAIPARVLTLTEGVLQVMLVNKLKAVVPTLMVLVACGTGGISYRMQAAADEPAKPAAEVKKEKPAEPGNFLRTINDARDKDLAAMQGMWVLTDGWIMSGEHTIDLAEFAGKARLLVELTKYTLFAKDAGRFERSTGLDYVAGIYDENLLDIFATVNPKQIILKGDGNGKGGETTYGIYTLDGDRLVVCFQMPEDGRPRNFDPAKGDAWGKCRLDFKRSSDSDQLKRERRLISARANLVQGVSKLIGSNLPAAANEVKSDGEYLRGYAETVDEVERIVQAERKKIKREMAEAEARRAGAKLEKR